ncbi:MAG TPA: helix-turn-helix transcriptional regulator [Streptosporangiaceae bacterium]
MSSFQRARVALGLRLRELRRDARLTGRQLAESQGWHPSKVSKIEAGKQTPSLGDIENWARACSRPDLAAELGASLRTLEEQYVEFRRLFRSGQRLHQVALAETEAEAESVRNFENVMVPGLLQTPGYARSMLSERLADITSVDDVDDAVAGRMQRQHALYNSGKRFHFIITEAALRYLLCPPDVMAGQLDRLVTLSTLTTVRFGVIPFSVQLPVIPLQGFYIYDDRAVHIENFTAALQLTQPSEIAAYAKLFDQLAETARYGASARAVITRALADLSATMR